MDVLHKTGPVVCFQFFFHNGEDKGAVCGLQKCYYQKTQYKTIAEDLEIPVATVHNVIKKERSAKVDGDFRANPPPQKNKKQKSPHKLFKEPQADLESSLLGTQCISLFIADEMKPIRKSTACLQ